MLPVYASRDDPKCIDFIVIFKSNTIYITKKKARNFFQASANLFLNILFYNHQFFNGVTVFIVQLNHIYSGFNGADVYIHNISCS